MRSVARPRAPHRIHARPRERQRLPRKLRVAAALLTGALGVAGVTVIATVTNVGATTETTLPISGLHKPEAIAEDPAGDLFIANYNTGTVTVFPQASGTIFGQTVTMGTPTTVLSGYSGAFAVACDSDGDLFLGQIGSGTVTVLTNAQRSIFGQTIDANTPTALTAASGGSSVTGLAFDHHGDLFIADYSGQALRVLPETSGSILGNPVSAHTLFQLAADSSGPMGLALDSAGDLFVANYGAGTVSAIAVSSGSLYGQSVTAGALSTVVSGLTTPNGLAFDGADNLFISDLAGVLFVEPKVTGTVFGQTVTVDTPVSVGAATGLSQPAGVLVDSAGSLLLANSAADSVVALAASPPTVTAVSPSAGAAAGGTTVGITGTNFTSASAVTFGTTAATGVTFDSSTHLTATAPAGSIGTVDVTVTSSFVSSGLSSADQYSYLGQQAISFSSTPPSHPLIGSGYTVSATGGASGNPVTFSVDASTTAGACSIAGSVVTFDGPGTCVVDANQAAGGLYLAAPQAQQSIVVGNAPQTIAFTSSAPSNATYGGTYSPSATATSSLPVTFSIDSTSAGVCTYSSGTGAVSFTGVGACVVDADQAGSGSYAPAARVQQSVTVATASQTISFTSAAPSSATYHVGSYTPSATASSSLTVTFSIDSSSTAGACTYASGTVSFTGVGTCVVDADQVGNGHYRAANQVHQSFAIGSMTQVVSFTSSAPTNATYGGSYTPSATISPTSVVPPVFSIDSSSASGVCGFSGSAVTFTGIGTCVIDATARGSVGFLSAVVQQQVTIAPAPLTIAASSGTMTFGHTPPAVTPSYVGFVNGDGATSLSTPPVCSTSATSTSSVSSYASRCSGAASANYDISYLAGAVQVTTATPTVSWTAPAAVSYGTPLSSAQLDATASVPGTFAYTPANGSRPSAGSDTLSVTFTPTDGTDYESVTTTVPIVVTKSTPTISWTTPSSIPYGTALSATQLNATTSVPGSFTYAPASGTNLDLGNDTLSVTFTPSDSSDYGPATKSVVLVVTKATPTISWTSPSSIPYGTALSATQLNATTTVPGAFTYTPASGATPPAGNDMLSVTFTPTDTTRFATVTKATPLTVTQVTPTITWPTPQPITEGAALSSTELNATASVPGSFSYSPALGSTPSAGSVNLTVAFTPNDQTDYVPVNQFVTLIVNAASPTTTTVPTTSTTTPPSDASTTLPPPPEGSVAIDINGAPGISISSSNVNVSGHGFKPGSIVQIVAHSTPQTLGTAPVGQDGTFATSVGLPSGLAAGAHHIIVSGTLNDGSAVAQEAAFTVASGGRLGTVGTPPPGPLQNEVAFVPAAHKTAVLAAAAGGSAALGAVSSSLGGGMSGSRSGGTGGGGRSGGSGGGGGGSGGGDAGGASGGYLEDVELERLRDEESGRGDRERSWVNRLPFSHHVDRHSRQIPARLAAVSPVLGRVSIDGDYLRAVLGSAWLLLCAGAIALGLYASASSGWYAVPPALGIFLAVLGVSIFDSTLGYLAGFSFFSSAVIAGHVTSPTEVRLGAGIVLLWFAVPLAAAALRPLRRTITMSLLSLWDRAADLVIGGLFAAWAAQKMTGALSGLAGVELPIGTHLNEIAIAVLGFVAVRIVIETVVAHRFPRRLQHVSHIGELEPENLQVALSLLVQIGLFLFISVAYVGSTWGLYVGAAVFFSPLVPWVFADKIPKSKFVTKWSPTGLVRWTLIIVFGVLLSRLLEHLVPDPKLSEALGFIILPLPVLIAWALELFEAEEGDEEHEEDAEHEEPRAAHDAPTFEPALVLAGVGGSNGAHGEAPAPAHGHHGFGIDWHAESARARFRELESERESELEVAREATSPTWRLWAMRLAGLPLVVVSVYLVVTHIAGG